MNVRPTLARLLPRSAGPRVASGKPEAIVAPPPGPAPSPWAPSPTASSPTAPTAPATAEAAGRVSGRVWTAIFLYAFMSLVSAQMGVLVERPIAYLALLTVPAMLWWRDRPVAVAVAMVLGGIWLRVAVAYAAPMTDQIETAQAAWRDVLAGLNPYGRDILGTSTNAPFPYGPLSLVAYIPGAWTEIAAAGATLAILGRQRAWLTLAIFAACPLTVRGAVMGLNDTLPGLLILLAMLEARRSPIRGAAILAVAVAVKPYAAAWLPGLIGLGGAMPLIVFGCISLVLWLPVLALWGVGAFLRSVQLATDLHTEQSAAIDIPPLRLLAVPLALVPVAWRSWQAAVWFGLGAYLVFLFFAHWASLGYLLSVVPLAGLALEMAVWPAPRVEPVAATGPAA